MLEATEARYLIKAVESTIVAFETLSGRFGL